jgi:hypothetical protein
LISRRIAIAATAMIIVLLSGNAALTFLLDVRHVPIQEQFVSTVKLSSPALRLPGRPTSPSLSWTGRSASLIYDWKDPETQRALGPITVTVLTSSKPVREWSRAGSVCGFLFDHAGPNDHLISAPDGDALTMKNMHVCKAVSTDDDRQWYYAYALPDPRCRRSALVYWKFPWELADGAPHDEDVNPRLDAGMYARGLNAIRGSIIPSVSCGAEVASVARATVIASIAGVASLLSLLMLIYKRSGI